MLPRIEVYGSEGTLLVPDPNTFGGPVRIWRAGSNEWSDIPLAYGKSENAHGVGAADMAKAILTGRSRSRWDCQTSVSATDRNHPLAYGDCRSNAAVSFFFSQPRA